MKGKTAIFIIFTMIFFVSCKTAGLQLSTDLISYKNKKFKRIGLSKLNVDQFHKEHNFPIDYSKEWTVMGECNQDSLLEFVYLEKKNSCFQWMFTYFSKSTMQNNPELRKGVFYDVLPLELKRSSWYSLTFGPGNMAMYFFHIDKKGKFKIYIKEPSPI